MCQHFICSDFRSSLGCEQKLSVSAGRNSEAWEAAWWGGEKRMKQCAVNEKVFNWEHRDEREMTMTIHHWAKCIMGWHEWSLLWTRPHPPPDCSSPELWLSASERTMGKCSLPAGLRVSISNPSFSGRRRSSLRDEDRPPSWQIHGWYVQRARCMRLVGGTSYSNSLAAEQLNDGSSCQHTRLLTADVQSKMWWASGRSVLLSRSF